MRSNNDLTIARRRNIQHEIENYGLLRCMQVCIRLIQQHNIGGRLLEYPRQRNKGTQAGTRLRSPLAGGVLVEARLSS